MAIKRGRIIAYNVVLTSVVMRLFYSGIRGQIECWSSVSFRKINSFDLMPTCTDYIDSNYMMMMMVMFKFDSQINLTFCNSLLEAGNRDSPKV